jgi:hypothetical protein
MSYSSHISQLYTLILNCNAPELLFFSLRGQWSTTGKHKHKLKYLNCFFSIYTLFSSLQFANSFETFYEATKN